MSTEYTPTVLALITAWVDQRRNLLDLTGEPPEGIVERTSQAQRAIGKIRAEAKAEALTELAEEAERRDSWGSALWVEEQKNYVPMHDWIRERANQYKDES